MTILFQNTPLSSDPIIMRPSLVLHIDGEAHHARHVQHKLHANSNTFVMATVARFPSIIRLPLLSWMHEWFIFKLDAQQHDMN